MELSLDTLVVASSRQVSTEVGDETVILELAEGAYYGLENVGSFVWSLLSEPRTVADLVDSVSREYDVTPDRCERDVLTLVEDLATSGLIEVRSAAAP